VAVLEGDEIAAVEGEDDPGIAVGNDRGSDAFGAGVVAGLAHRLANLALEPASREWQAPLVGQAVEARVDALGLDKDDGLCAGEKVVGIAVRPSSLMRCSAVTSFLGSAEDAVGNSSIIRWWGGGFVGIADAQL
jgi:hypothetical protein